jgi:hypothetical protein
MLNYTNNSAKKFQFLVIDSKDTEQKRNSEIDTIMTKCDLDLKKAKHALCISSLKFCPEISISFHLFKQYRQDTKPETSA